MSCIATQQAKMSVVRIRTQMTGILSMHTVGGGQFHSFQRFNGDKAFSVFDFGQPFEILPSNSINEYLCDLCSLLLGPRTHGTCSRTVRASSGIQDSRRSRIMKWHPLSVSDSCSSSRACSIQYKLTHLSPSYRPTEQLYLSLSCWYIAEGRVDVLRCCVFNNQRFCFSSSTVCRWSGACHLSRISTAVLQDK